MRLSSFHVAHLFTAFPAWRVTPDDRGRGAAAAGLALSTRDSQPAEAGQVAVIGAVAAPGVCPCCGTCVRDSWRAGWAGRLDEVRDEGDPCHGVVSTTKEGLSWCARPEPVSTKLKPCPACLPWSLRRAYVRIAYSVPGFVLSVCCRQGFAGPAPPFVPRSAQEGGCQTGGTDSEHRREPCPVLNPVP